MLTARCLLGAGLMVWYTGAQSQNPPVTDSPDSDRENPTERSQAAQHNSAAIPKTSPILGASQQFSSSDRAEDRDSKKSDTQQERMWPPSLGWAAVFVAAVSAIATIVYAFISWGQWRVLRTQNRPWIMVTPGNPEGWPPADTGPCTFRLKWSVDNVGNSPAFLTHLWANLVVLPYPVPNKRLDYGEDIDFAEFVIPPNGNHCHEEHRVLSEPDVMRIQTGDKCLLFYGLVDYRDTFYTTHRTRFCSYWIQEAHAATLNTHRTASTPASNSDFICSACGILNNLDFKREIAKVEGMLTGSDPPSEFDIDRLQPEIFSGIGRLIAWWGYLEFQLGVIIREVTKLSDDTGRVLLTGQGVRVLCATVRTLTRFDRWIKDEGIRKDLTKLADDVDKRSDRRNDYAHGVFDYDKDKNVFVLHLFRRSAHRVTPVSQPIDAESLEDLSDEARDLWIRAHGITGRLKALMRRRS